MERTDNYWQQALDSLGETTKEHLRLISTNKIDVLSAVLREAKEARQHCIRKNWKFKKPNGDTIILRDVLEKIIKWVDRFRVVGDVAIQYDPTAASLPWAGVRFLLQATVNSVQNHGAMINDLEAVSRIVVRYREFERVHLAGQSAPTLRLALEKVLTSLYAEVLVYLAKAARYFQGPTAGNSLDNLTLIAGTDQDWHSSPCKRCSLGAFDFARCTSTGSRGLKAGQSSGQREIDIS